MTEYPALCSSPICVGLKQRGDREPSPLCTDGRAHLCEPCTRRLRDDLQSIADNWHETTINLAAATSALDNDGKKTKASHTSVGINLNDSVARARSKATEIVWYMARVAIDEADGHPPVDQSTPSLAEWLARWHVGLFVANEDQGIAEGVAQDAREAARRMHSAAHPTGARKIATELPCPEYAELPNPDTGERVHCEGTMATWVWLGMDRTPDLVCSINPEHRIEPEVWTRSHWKRRLAKGMHVANATRLARLIAGA